MITKVFDSIILLRFGKAKLGKKELYGLKKAIKIDDADVDNRVISKSVETKNNSKYFTGCLDHVLRPLILVMPKLSGYVRTFKDKDADKDHNKNNKLMSFLTVADKLLEKYRNISTKIGTYGHKVYIKFIFTVYI